MATITTQNALERITEAVGKAHPDDLAEIYNELFPEAPATEDSAKANRTVLLERIVKHIDSGLEVQEVLDLWNVIFPRHRSIWFDDEEGLIHFDENGEPVGWAE